MMVKRNRKLDDIAAGKMFQHSEAGRRVETATVLAVVRDPLGIPHVRYNLRIKRNDYTVEDGPRTLALFSFADYYSERA